MSVALIAQTRVNRGELSFINSTGQLDKVTGWYYNDQKGEWVDYDGIIFLEKIKPVDANDKQEMLRARSIQNYESLTFKTVLINATTYYILIIELWDGKYKYPSIREGYYYWLDTYAYIFTENDFNKLKQINGLIELKTWYEIQFGYDKSSYNEKDFLDMIQSKILNGPKSDFEFVFPVLKTQNEGVDVIRFLLPDKYRFIKYNLSKNYFETSPEKFKILTELK